jgi:hypothetical protein
VIHQIAVPTILKTKTVLTIWRDCPCFYYIVSNIALRLRQPKMPSSGIKFIGRLKIIVLPKGKGGAE